MSDNSARHPSLPFYVSTDFEIFDLDRMHGWIAGTYWAKDIPFDIFRRSFVNSLSFGLFHQADGQAGSARMITDRATFAYLADVFIDPDYRGLGLGRWFMDIIMVHPDLQGLRRMMLATSNMHPLYRQVGFTSLTKPEIMMEISRPGLYSQSKES